MKQRNEEGIKKYGTPLQVNNGRNPLIDAYQEALDLCVYLRQAIEEQKLNEEMFLAEHDENVRLHTELEKLIEEKHYP